MIRFSQGKLILEKRVIDLSTFEVRPKITEQDLERDYDSFILRVREVGDYFEDASSFDRAIIDAADEKRPKLIARETRYPFLWAFRTKFMPFDFLRPSTRRLHDNYFMVAHCMSNIPRKTEPEDREKPLDEKLRGDITEKFKRYPGYEGIIEIPNDETQAKAKANLFHEATHYILGRYLAETGRSFVKTFIREDLPQLEKYQAEHAMQEHAVDMLSDKLLVHDSEALFEARWPSYCLYDIGFTATVRSISALATALLLGCSVSCPYLLPLAIIPVTTGNLALKKHKETKKEEILTPFEYPRFKI